MEKILITYNVGTALRDISIIKKQVIPYIVSEILPIYKELDLVPMDKETLKDLVKSGGENVEAKLIKNIEGQLNKAGIKSMALRSNMIAEALEPLERLRHAVTSEPVFLPFLFQQVSFENGKPVLSDTDKEEIEERNKVYVTIEEGKSLRDLHLHAIKTVNDLLTVIQKNAKITGPYPLGQIIKINDGDIITALPAEINYDALAVMAGYKIKDNDNQQVELKEEFEVTA